MKKEMTMIADRELITLHRVLVPMVEEENKHQIEKFGVQCKSPFEWMTNLTEEVGELAEAITEVEYNNATLEAVRREAIQVATLALKIAEMYN
jgi:NTP pyrophosphatase (non-canonical NTP hydrolase)